MKKHRLEITESELLLANNYILRKFESQPWWPREQPGEAQHEFNLMQGSPISLNIWCEKWLDTAQQKQLAKAIKNDPYS